MASSTWSSSRPTASWQGIPFEAIPLEDGSYLIEHLAFVYLQDMTQLVRLGDTPSIELDSLLAVGGVRLRRAHGPRCPRRENESQAIFDAHARAFGEEGLRLLLRDSEPTEERLARELPRFHVLHLATHAFFNPAGLPSIWSAAVEGAERSQAAPGPVGRTPPRGSSPDSCAPGQASPRRSTPMAISRQRRSSWLDLSEVELAVLSACDTGLGRRQPGEGLAGLRRAFEVAGARTVISSLWSVPDESTAELMQTFYGNLFERRMGRLEKPCARRNSTSCGAAEPSQARAGSSTWAAFVLSGEWR